MGRGGKRPGAGRRRGSGKYGEPTRPVRLPISWASRLPELLKDLRSCSKDNESLALINEVYQPDNSTIQFLPFYLAPVAAGFPSISEDCIERELDISQHLLSSPESTFLARATGEFAMDLGIYPEDLLIVDTTLSPQDGNIVIAALEGELTLKRLYQTPEKILLLPETADYSPLSISPNKHILIWGIVTHIIHAL